MSQTDPAPAAIEHVAKLGTAIAKLSSVLGVEAPAFGPGEAERATATVVVVGEPKNGKSTLVNALLGQAGLSPVDYAVATATYIAMRHGSPAAAFVHPDGATGPEEVHLDELPAWTSVDGLAGNPRAPRTPQPVEVRLPAPLLEHLVLVDTPGVGGFDGAHDRATLAALSGATSLLLCADGSRPLSEPELAFLGKATESIAMIGFVLTKVDQHPAWRDVLADNRKLVAERAPAFAGAPWFPVAAPLAEKSLDPALPAPAVQALLERSGLGAVTGHLTTTVAGRARELGAANTVKAMRATATHLLDVARERAGLLGDPTAERLEQLSAQEAELAALQSVEDTWRTDLDLDLTALRAAELNRLDRTVKAISDTCGPLAKDTKVPVEAFTGEVNRLLTAESAAISERIVADINDHIRRVVGDAVESPAFAMAIEAAERHEQVVHLRAARDLVAEGRLQPAQTMPLLMSGTSGFMLASYTGLGGSVAALTGVASFVPGLGMAVAATATAVLFARKQSKVNERTTWLQGRLTEARSDLQTVIDQRVTTAKALALRAVREWIRTRQSELKASVAELTAQTRRDADDRRVALAGANARVKDAESVLRACDNVLERLTAGGP